MLRFCTYVHKAKTICWGSLSMLLLLRQEKKTSRNRHVHILQVRLAFQYDVRLFVLPRCKYRNFFPFIIEFSLLTKQSAAWLPNTLHEFGT